MAGHHLGILAERSFEAKDPDDRHTFFEGTWHTRGALFDRSTRLAAGLQRLGVGAGDRVAVVMANTPDVGALYSAIWRAGAVATPVIFLLPPQELRHVFTDGGIRVVCTTPEFLANVQQAAAGLDLTIVVDGGGEGAVALDEVAGADPGPLVDREDDDLAALMYTGGTTGRSKGVMLSHANLWHAGRIAHEAGEDHRLRRTIVPLPLSHAFGLLVTVAGMADPDPEPSPNVLMRWFDPVGFLELAAEHRMEQATLVPAMVQLLLAQPLEDHDLSALQRVVVGSAPLAPELAEEFERRVPGARVCEGYGLTETCGATTTNRYTNRRIGTVGQPLPEVELRIVGDDGKDLPPGRPGEVLVSSPTNALGYWDAPEATAATFQDGWVRTGDIGHLDEDGFLTVVDRKKDLVIRNGFNVYPRDVEDALHEHPAVASAGVVGRPDREVGEEVVAFVTATPGADLDADELRAWARERLGAKSYPREIHVVEQLPLTPVMKLDRKALRALL